MTLITFVAATKFDFPFAAGNYSKFNAIQSIKIILNEPTECVEIKLWSVHFKQIVHFSGNQTIRNPSGKKIMTKRAVSGPTHYYYHSVDSKT